jgi:osmotically inducible protein OsmC
MRGDFAMAIEKAIYTAHTRATGGRAGTAKSDDGQIDLKLDRPIEMGGKGNGTNPEQLFAAGYAACFIGALRVVAGKRHIWVPEDVSIDSAVSFGPLAGGVEGFGIAVSMTIHLPGIERATAEELMHLAHRTCPYSNATRGNIDVLLTLG